MSDKCIAIGCDRTDIRARGMCGRHYSHWLKYGDPNKYLRHGDKERGSLTKNFLREYRGEIHTVSEWSQKKGFPKAVLYNRIMLYKWNIKEALETPYKKRVRRSE